MINAFGISHFKAILSLLNEEKNSMFSVRTSARKAKRIKIKRYFSSCWVPNDRYAFMVFRTAYCKWRRQMNNAFQNCNRCQFQFLYYSVVVDCFVRRDELNFLFMFQFFGIIFPLDNWNRFTVGNRNENQKLKFCNWCVIGMALIKSIVINEKLIS